jgi:hypothetical protein
MTDLSDDTLRQVRTAEVQAMGRDQKLRWLRSRGWRSAGNNRWRSRNGMLASFGNAVHIQLMAELDEAE